MRAIVADKERDGSVMAEPLDPDAVIVSMEAPFCEG